MIIPKSISVLIACLLCTTLQAQRPDPTKPSDQISQKLSSSRSAPVEAGRSVPLPELHLKAILVRDSENAVALLESSSGKKSILELAKRNGQLQPFRFASDGVEFEVLDFTSTVVVLRPIDSQKSIRVN